VCAGRVEECCEKRRMDWTKRSLVLVGLQLLLFCFDAHAIKCYDCRSDSGQCKTGECKIDGGICSKREKNYGNGTWTVIKGCRGAPVKNRTCEYDQSLAPGGQICFCDAADFCNSAYSTIQSYSNTGTLYWTLILIAFSLIFGA